MQVLLPMSETGPKTSLNTAYIDYVIDAGFRPVLVIDDEDIVEEEMKTADALILPGGTDVDPTYYGVDNNYSFSVDPERDNFERLLVGHAIKKGIPIFGICRGHQLMAYEIGKYVKGAGGLWVKQNIHDHDQKGQDVERSFVSHSIVHTGNLYDSKGDPEKVERIFVNSMHHQAVLIDKEDIPELEEAGVQVLAYTQRGAYSSSTDKAIRVVVEAMAVPNIKLLSVQWHPEETKDYDLLQTALTRWE